ncbi:MAG: LuxR C-terminal-related transcriptional regulator, partial [Candidatus Dadabacteria bacterium]|nr:LuxR C-terminal-related transcriptional regulator [Candidatus Dadabacteria bacterium]
ESRIIKLIAAGESNKDIAELLSVSEKTVKAHITNIFHKLHLQNRYQLMIYGKRKKKNIEVNL